MSASGTGAPRVVVVGACAAGKSTLVRGLRAAGYDAMVCGQEHSEIAALWRRQQPDVLIGLRVDLATVRRRRGVHWSAAVFAAQCRRLAPAMAAADVIIDATTLDAAAVLAAALAALPGRRSPPAPNNTIDRARSD